MTTLLQRHRQTDGQTDNVSVAIAHFTKVAVPAVRVNDKYVKGS